MLTLLCFVAILGTVIGDLGPEVTVKQGRLRGKYRVTRGNRSFSAFEGIPFAKPPLGELRFKAPVPVEAWDGVKEVTQIHNICPQRDIYRRAVVIEGDEDCLYLNVYTPQTDKNPSQGFPVMIFFHGGGWLCGGGNSLWYGPSILLDRDVILVVTNYRLGALGFLTTGDEVAPGNNGMKDQNLAMRWVKENIAQFGGDSQKINIFGESAGGASVQLHMTSPLSKGLFESAISQSGTAHCLWAVAPGDQGVRNSRILAEEFGCGTGSSEEIVECLRTVPANDLIAKDTVFMKWDTDPMIPFKPTIEPDLEGAFLVEHPIDSVKSGKFTKVPWIIGLNANDGALRAAGIFGNPHLIDELEEKFDEVVPMSLEYDQTSPRLEEITTKIRNFYFGGAKVNATSRSDVVDMYTDGWFLFEHRGIASFTEIFGDKSQDYGVCHADELQYLFPVGDGLFPDRPPTEDDKKIAKILTTLWVNFAQYGNPTPTIDDTIPNKWEPVTSEDMEYYHINLAGPIHDKINEIKDEL